jgi:lipoteichoic acid synthase
MFKNFFTANIKKIHYSFKEKSYRKTSIVIVLFIIMNALKSSLYDFFLIPQANKDIFRYKFWFTLLCCIILYSIVLSFKSRYVFLLVFVLQCIYSYANISYFLYYHSYLHFLQWISLFKEAIISATHLANPKSIQLLVVFIDVPLALYIFVIGFKKEVRKFRLPVLKNLVLVLALLILMAVEINNYYTGKSIINYMDDRYTGETQIVARYGTLVNSGINIIKNYSEQKLIEQLTYGYKLSGPSQTILGNKVRNSPTINAGKPNYVIIQVESMDANIAKQQYKDSYVMPFLSSLRESSVYYPYTLSYHKGGGTSDTEFSIINSVEPLDSFPAIKLTSYNYPNSVISKLSKASYSTMAFHGNVGTFYNRDVAFSKMGFKNFYDINSMKYTDEGWGAPDDKVFSFAFDKMVASSKPFLSYVITMTSHGPFESARNYYNNARYDDIEDELVKNYFNSMNYVDDSIKAFVLKVQANFPNTYIFIYGDHTPNIHAEEYSQASFLDGDRYFEFVPLFIITPNKQKHLESSVVASFLDISPTILGSSGIPYIVYSDGTNLLREDISHRNIPVKNGSFDRTWLYDKVSTNTYSEEEPLWRKYLPSFITSNLIEHHNK